MHTLTHRWTDEGTVHELRLVPVPGTAGLPFAFGRAPHTKPVEIRDFHISTTPVTQALWFDVMGEKPWKTYHPRRPADEVSWHHITAPGGFLERINASPILRALAGDDSSPRFRLPSEAEWEYAARGGPHWREGCRFSGSNDIEEVAWYGNRWRGGRLKWEVLKRLKRWRLWNAQQRGVHPTHPHDVATKKPNQLGIHDMSGNVWEWCQDVCAEDLDLVPGDGSAYEDAGTERRLRGGCHHNWDIHCTVWWRYGIAPDAHDGCIGFRIVLGPEARPAG